MSDFGDYRRPVGRKEHSCGYCGWRIPVGEKHVQYVGVYDGEFQDWRMHNECFDDFNNSGEETFFPGESNPPARIRELYKK
jgi:hypothetical protein